MSATASKLHVEAWIYEGRKGHPRSPLRHLTGDVGRFHQRKPSHHWNSPSKADITARSISCTSYLTHTDTDHFGLAPCPP